MIALALLLLAFVGVAEARSDKDRVPHGFEVREKAPPFRAAEPAVLPEPVVAPTPAPAPPAEEADVSAPAERVAAHDEPAPEHPDPAEEPSPARDEVADPAPPGPEPAPDPLALWPPHVSAPPVQTATIAAPRQSELPLAPLLSVLGIAGVGAVLVTTRRTREPKQPAAPVAAPAPTGFDALLREGQRRLNAGDVEGALSCFEEARDLRPRVAVAHFCSGLCLDALGRTADAFRAFSLAVDADPAEVAHRVHLARAAAALGMAHEAMAALEPLTEALPELHAAFLEDAGLAPLRDHPRFLAMTGAL